MRNAPKSDIAYRKTAKSIDGNILRRKKEDVSNLTHTLFLNKVEPPEVDIPTCWYAEEICLLLHSEIDFCRLQTLATYKKCGIATFVLASYNDQCPTLPHFTYGRGVRHGIGEIGIAEG